MHKMIWSFYAIDKLKLQVYTLNILQQDRKGRQMKFVLRDSSMMFAMRMCSMCMMRHAENSSLFAS